MQEDYVKSLTDMLGFYPKIAGTDGVNPEEEVIEFDEGFTGRNRYVFFGFILLVLVMLGLLVRNFMMKEK